MCLYRISAIFIFFNFLFKNQMGEVHHWLISFCWCFSNVSSYLFFSCFAFYLLLHLAWKTGACGRGVCQDTGHAGWRAPGKEGDKHDIKTHLHLISLPIEYLFCVSSPRLVKALMKNKPLVDFTKKAAQTLLLAAWAVHLRPTESRQRMWSVLLLRRTFPLWKLALN